MSTPKATGIALITGASRGIGAVYADRLARRGYDLILVARDQRRLEQLASKIAIATKRQVSILTADLSQDAGIRSIERELDMNGRINVVVNNAGIATMGKALADADIVQSQAVIQLNVVALTRIARAAASAFTRRRFGTLINISSALAINVRPNTAVYSGTSGPAGRDQHRHLERERHRRRDASEGHGDGYRRARRRRARGPRPGRIRHDSLAARCGRLGAVRATAPRDLEEPVARPSGRALPPRRSCLRTNAA